MVLPTGTISMANVNVELGRSSTATISLGETAVRTLAGVASGTISMNDLRGKSAGGTFDPDGGTTLGTAVFLFNMCRPVVIWVYPSDLTRSSIVILGRTVKTQSGVCDRKLSSDVHNTIHLCIT